MGPAERSRLHRLRAASVRELETAIGNVSAATEHDKIQMTPSGLLDQATVLCMGRGRSYPALTTVAQPIDAIADAAVEALWSLLEDPDRHVPNFLFRPQLRPGGSTAPYGRD